MQSFKLAGYALWPFGRVVVERPGASPALGCLGNVLWLVLAELRVRRGDELYAVRGVDDAERLERGMTLLLETLR